MFAFLLGAMTSTPPGAADAEVAAAGGWMLRGLLSLALVLGLLVGLFLLHRWMQRAKHSGGSGSGIGVEAHKALGRHAWVALLTIGERRILVGVTQQRITRLGAWGAETSDRRAERAAKKTGIPDLRAETPGAAIAGPGRFAEELERRLDRLRRLRPVALPESGRVGDWDGIDGTS
jgi:flagellar biogenesis protein FliO